MINELIKKLKKSLSPSLIAESFNNYFIVYEKDVHSSIKQIKCVFKNLDNILVIQQRNQFISQKILKDYSTSKSCDFIVLFVCKNQLNIVYCEIKTSYTDKTANESLQQIECSRLFMGYLFDCYSYFYKENIDKNNITFKHYLIYDRKGIPNKNKTYIKNDMVLHIRDKDVDYDGNIELKDANSFFGIA